MTAHLSTTPVRLGMLRLSDAAPIVWAKERGLFEAAGLDVAISVEPSWSNIADKLGVGLLDGGALLQPLALAIALGLRGLATPLTIPMALSLRGNPLTFATGLAADIAERAGRDADALTLGRALAGLLAERRAARPDAPLLRFAIVHRFSGHHLLTRYWLAASGIDPDRDLVLDAIPPADMIEPLKSGRIIGFCAGPPWGERAAREGVGATLLRSSDIWRQHPEKCLGLRSAWAEANPQATVALTTALIEAAQACDRPENADELAALLASPAYLDLDAATIRAALPAPPPGGHADASAFFEHTATFPWRSHARWFMTEMIRWGYCEPSAAMLEAAAASYRPDLHRLAAVPLGLSLPLADTKDEGAHAEPWSLPAAPAPIPMRPDRFCDGAVFRD